MGLVSLRVSCALMFCANKCGKGRSAGFGCPHGLVQLYFSTFDLMVHYSCFWIVGIARGVF